jgi:TRAP-type C4-dicarboxylate transport system substrate-binding protein
MPVARRWNSLHRVQAAVVGLGVWMALTPGAVAQELTLKAAVFVPPTTTYGIPFKRFVDHVNESGKGVLQIRVVGGPEAVPADGQAQAVKSGVLTSPRSRRATTRAPWSRAMRRSFPT